MKHLIIRLLEVTKRTELSRSTIYDRIKEGLPAMTCKCPYLVEGSELQAFF